MELGWVDAHNGTYYHDCQWLFSCLVGRWQGLTIDLVQTVDLMHVHTTGGLDYVEPELVPLRHCCELGARESRQWMPKETIRCGPY